MLTNFELSFTIIGSIVIQVITYVILRIKKGSNKPDGTIVENDSSASQTGRITVNPLLWAIALFGLCVYFIIVIRLIGHCLTSSWESSNLYTQAIRFPIWVNYTGIAVIFFSGILKGSIMIYNINFTPFFFPMKKNYMLATGGPYKFVRHPIYVLHVLWALSFFLMTGIQWFIISFVCYLSYIPQAYCEEKALQKIFGSTYDDYKSKTGMFFPKLFNR